jgi:hypothetical protein
MLPEAGSLDREREGSKASASEGARLRAAACGEPTARDATADDRIPHVVRSAGLFSHGVKGVGAATQRRAWI